MPWEGWQVSRAFEELDHQVTPIGEISLRRRLEPTLLVDVWEVKLDDEFLMSSLFTATEEALAQLGLAACTAEHLDVVVGGLGLGYTATTVLADPRVRRLDVIESLPPVIDWHLKGLVPLGPELTADNRCRLVNDDFFATVDRGLTLPSGLAREVDAILVDIDHTPRHHLDDGHAGFYQPNGLRRVRDHLRPGGVFALWSDDPPDDDFLSVLGQTFGPSSKFPAR